MSYKSLYKLYVMNDYTTFNRLFDERFNSNSTIKFDLFINDNQAFFNYDVEIMELVAKINSYNHRINFVFDFLPNIAQSQYMRRSLIDEIEYTNQIEGIILTRKDINDLITEIEKKTSTNNRFEGIVNRYLMLTEEKVKLNASSDIRKLYDEMLYNEIKAEDEKNLPDGLVFRKEAVHVYKLVRKLFIMDLCLSQK